MCGRIILHLNENLNKLVDVRCIGYERKYSFFNYRFLSLINLQHREIINKLIKKPSTLNHILKFDFENIPVYSVHFLEHIYFFNHLDVIDNCSSNGTSIIKMSTKSLKCIEIY